MKARITSSIFGMDASEVKTLKNYARTNWALHTMLLAKQMKIDFAQDQRDGI
jgi:hypothetical protein